MNLITNLFQSSVGKKYIMAITGGCLLLFVLGHLAGNLQIFLGREIINRYAHFLQSNPELIWPVRMGMLVILALHIWAGITLSLENKAARPVAYAQYQPFGSTFASQTMLLSGLMVFAFLGYHLLHYTAKVQFINLTHQDFAAFTEKLPGPASVERPDIFKMMVVGFRKPIVSAFYVLGLALLGVHLSHGASSLFHSLGWRTDAYRPCLDRAARVLALLLFLGYCAIPAAILCGYGKEVLCP